MANKKWDKDKCFEEGKKYKTRHEFQHNSSQAFHLSMINGWIDEMTWMPKKEFYPKGYWNIKEHVIEESKKYKTSKEFRENCGSAYNAARRGGYVDELTWLEKRENVLPFGYWRDKEHVMEEAKKYTSKKEFQKNNQSAYWAALKYGYLEEMPWLVKNKVTKKGILTKEYVLNESKKYKTRNEFRKCNKSAYEAAQRNGYLKEMVWLPKQADNGYWNVKEHVIEEAKKYSSRTSFKENGKGAYWSALKHGWMDEMEWLKKRNEKGVEHEKRKWKTKEIIFEESKKYSSRTEFRKKAKRACEIASKNKWLDEMVWLNSKNIYLDKVDTIYGYFFEEQNAVYIGRSISMELRDYQHRTTEKDSVYKFAKENNVDVPKFRIVESGLTVPEGAIRETFWADYYKEKGFNIINKVSCGSIGSMGKGKWSKTKCLEESKKYKTRGEFFKGSNPAYQKSLKEGWIDEMTWLKSSHSRQRGFWEIKEHVIEESKKYKTATEFQAKCPGAFGAARKNGYYKELTWLKSNGQKEFGYWNVKEHVMDEAKKYKTMEEFRKQSPYVFRKAKQTGYINEMEWLDIKKKIMS